MSTVVIETVKDLIFWEYATQLYEPTEEDEATDPLTVQIVQERKHKFILEKYYQLQKDQRGWMNLYPEQIREDACSYCSSVQDIQKTELVYGKTCPRVEKINFVYACASCRDSRGDKEFLSWWKEHFPMKPVDRVLMRKYLKILYACHSCVGTLFRSLPDPYKFEDILDVWDEECHYKPSTQDKSVYVDVPVKKSSKLMVVLVSITIVVGIGLIVYVWLGRQAAKAVMQFSTKLVSLREGMSREEFDNLFSLYKPIKTSKKGNKEILVYEDISGEKGGTITFYFSGGRLIEWKRSNKH